MARQRQRPADADDPVRRSKFTGDPRMIEVVGYWDDEKQEMVRYTPEEQEEISRKRRKLLDVKRQQMT